MTPDRDRVADPRADVSEEQLARLAEICADWNVLNKRQTDAVADFALTHTRFLLVQLEHVFQQRRLSAPVAPQQPVAHDARRAVETPDVAALAKNLEAYVVAMGSMHEDDCPGDDTCECAWAPANDAANAACRYYAALAAEPSSAPTSQPASAGPDVEKLAGEAEAMGMPHVALLLRSAPPEIGQHQQASAPGNAMESALCGSKHADGATCQLERQHHGPHWGPSYRTWTSAASSRVPAPVESLELARELRKIVLQQRERMPWDAEHDGERAISGPALKQWERQTDQRILAALQRARETGAGRQKTSAQQKREEGWKEGWPS